jgi:hypothetical protein
LDLAGLIAYAWETLLQQCEGLLAGALQVVVGVPERQLIFDGVVQARSAFPSGNSDGALGCTRQIHDTSSRSACQCRAWGTLLPRRIIEQ